MNKYRTDIFITILSSLFLANGFTTSQTQFRSEVKNMLQNFQKWSLNYLVTFGIAMIFNLVTFNLILRYKKEPILKENFHLTKKFKISSFIKMVIGSFFTGMGWGIGKISPTSMILNFQFMIPHLIFFYFFLFILGQTAAYFAWNKLIKTIKKYKGKNKKKKELKRKKQFLYFLLLIVQRNVLKKLFYQYQKKNFFQKKMFMI